MDFFEAQDQAKTNTTRLVVLFVVAVVAIIVITNVLVLVVLRVSAEGTTAGLPQGDFFGFRWDVFLFIGAAIAAVIVIGSLYKLFTLRGGGKKIAENMNGKLVLSGDDDLKKQQLLNVVEEMAIASGTPVPPVYLIDETGINAFAAGYSPADAVIGITQGAVDSLDRDEMQGVIAHEFSHILNGDMRLNLRLVGVLHGILILRLIGEALLRGNRSSSRSSNSKGNLPLGLVFLIVGWVGWYFGGLIKAAVSRQREFLADASAVQFTRNPNGIAAALMKIHTNTTQSFITRPASREFNHALFEAGSKSDMRGAGATHPPTEDRIRAILPRWDGSYDLIRDSVGEKESGVDNWAQQQNEGQAQDESKPAKAEAFAGGITSVILADALLNQIGNPTPAHIDYADKILQAVPEKLLEAAHDLSGARAVIYLLVLSKDETTRDAQIKLLAENADPGVHVELIRLSQSVSAVDPDHRLPVATIAMSTLRQLSDAQYARFKTNFQKLIHIDKKISLMEWSLQKIVFHNLDASFDGKRNRLGRKSLKVVKESLALLLSVLAHSNAQENLSAGQAFTRGTNKLGIGLVFLEKEDISFSKLDTALDELCLVKPLEKPLLLKACVE
ncbi:MAG: M48 family metallopeptidase, partial [Pseudomonadales bacterium]|nr:M48 family metallopeptidase [Pseudomonadales bacterium]